MINNYNDLSLGRYMKIDKILRTPAEEIDKQVQIVAILADMNEKDVLTLPLADYASMAAQVAFLGTYCEPEQTDPEAMDLNGMHLVPTKDLTKIITAQYVDFQVFSKDFPSTLPELLSVFLVPEGKTYNEGYDVADVQKAVLEMPLPKAMGLSAFFFKSFCDSIADSATSLSREIRKMPEGREKEELKKKIREAEALLSSIGAGSPTSTE